MKVFLTKKTRINNRWEDDLGWCAYDEHWFGWASSHSKEDLIRICEKHGWEYEDYVPPKRKRLDPVTWQPIDT